VVSSSFAQRHSITVRQVAGVTADSKRVLVLIPAFNEKPRRRRDREVQAAMPGTPILVVEIARWTPRAARRTAGAKVLALPHHLGLGGCVQAGYRLAYELGYEYVIRVDGDGQHDPRDIPTILKALNTVIAKW
jgi:hypothetical protein